MMLPQCEAPRGGKSTSVAFTATNIPTTAHSGPTDAADRNSNITITTACPGDPTEHQLNEDTRKSRADCINEFHDNADFPTILTGAMLGPVDAAECHLPNNHIAVTALEPLQVNKFAH